MMYIAIAILVSILFVTGFFIEDEKSGIGSVFYGIVLGLIWPVSISVSIIAIVSMQLAANLKKKKGL